LKVWWMCNEHLWKSSLGTEFLYQKFSSHIQQWLCLCDRWCTELACRQTIVQTCFLQTIQVMSQLSQHLPLYQYSKELQSAIFCVHLFPLQLCWINGHCWHVSGTSLVLSWHRTNHKHAIDMSLYRGRFHWVCTWHWLPNQFGHSFPFTQCFTPCQKKLGSDKWSI
jgi:hypothetical protein